MNYHYFYILWTSIYIFLWVVFYGLRRDLRLKMLLVSVVSGFCGTVTECVHIIDWWQPITLTGTKIGIEDFLIGFAIGGISSVIYEIIFQKKLVPIFFNKPHDSKRGHIFRGIFIAIFLILFFIFHFHSFYAITIPCILVMGMTCIFRKDLAFSVFMTGSIMLILGIGVYCLLFLLYPGYIQKFWYLGDYWFAQIFLGIPYGEYVWFFLIGAVIGPFYNFTERLKMVNLK